MANLTTALRQTSLLLAISILISINTSCSQPPQQPSTATGAEAIQQHRDEFIGPPRIEQISEHVWTALGFGLAVTSLIHTPQGNIIVDCSICPAEARAVKKALSEKAPPGPIKAIIYTHSHIDHIGGATVWKEKDTEIWATDPFIEHFFKQYGLFAPAETRRGWRQMGYHVSREALPCSSIGPILEFYTIEDMAEVGVVMPTKFFSGNKTLDFGGLKIEMHEAHGETPDTLFVWIPQDKTLLAADNFYHVFPNLYTIRGTSPRPVDDWIKSIDAMRRLEPEHLVPGHTNPIHGKEKIAEVLTNYRDAIQWVRDEVVRRANRGEDIDTITESIKLQPHLANLPYLREWYGQVDWSARAIYTNSLGWFDGRPDKLYPMNHNEAAKREITLMGGPDKVLELAAQALQEGDARWAIHLLAKLEDSGLASDKLAKTVSAKLAEAYTRLAETVHNTNGRGYLLESAIERTQGMPPISTSKLPEELVANVPLERIFANMAVYLDPEKARSITECVHFIFPDVNQRFIVNVRNGIAEIAEGTPLPGTPQPLATLTTDSKTYTMMALKMLDTATALKEGKVKIDGNRIGFLKFMGRFQTR
ncbi:MAG: MBL fold metallo-hydrolase [Chloroflexi bacterium]|nr:MBL fold metallo-hydrolase [Chloroflexota bacterium]